MKEALYRKIIWDYNIPKEELEKLLSNQISSYSGLNRDTLIPRLLQRLSWEELIGLLGLDEIKRILLMKTYTKLKDPMQRLKYEQLSRLLQGKTLSFSGWDPENRERIRATLLSNRWYRSQ